MLATWTLLAVVTLGAPAPAPAPVAPTVEPAKIEAAKPEPDPVVTYTDQRGKKLVATFHNDVQTVTVKLGNRKALTLKSDPAASGVRYSLGKKTFWEHHGECTYSDGDTLVFKGNAPAQPEGN